MIPRTLFSAEHEDYRRLARRFLADEVLPFHAQWEKEKRVPREVWRRAGELGLLLPCIPEEYGGYGADRLYAMIVGEENSGSGASGLAIGFGVHSLVAGYILNYGSESQKQTWLPKMVSGEAIGSIAMTEPNTGSDLQGVKTRAVRDGDEYVINGSKTFISNGVQSDFAVVVCKTGTTGTAKDVSLIIVESGRPGYAKSQPLEKVGLHAQDTCMLFFEDVRVPCSNLLGAEEGQGFGQLMRDLAWERITGAIGFQAQAEAALRHTIEYTKGRTAFGKAIIDFQNSRFKLAELKSEIQIGRSWVDSCMALALRNELSPEAAAAAKHWTAELSLRVVEECLQLHGGNGYMTEYPIARLYLDTRGNRIWGGSREIMKEIIARTL
ncbi:acyl-CoA dehydrogenase family protein [Pseudomonas sp. GD03860]|uniref:acyl-CoA dehydrogenase family protein n=1 Tax=Pseudomonas TaxID=286 RepID=UPI002363408D|nr:MULTISPECIES: acyl-CoA dehydrogenase family protein [Pseudomonas]MDD2058550.1 acyl-CoA dehydrogenase family protein [Pseudomonas putida]MDH0640732.1 acyl-CoA dehydrogenase family protein [Pseudomonas sp. GD03860]